MELFSFLLWVFGISLTGALSPGPVTTVAIAMGARNRWAGTLMALGHGVVEFPLMVLLIFGVGRFLQIRWVEIGIGLAGGAIMMFIACQMFRGLRRAGDAAVQVTRSGPFAAGIFLSGGNPYFLIWWATMGLAMITQARGFGGWAFVLFALTHWSCDLIWLTTLSWASFKGTAIFGPRGQRIVLAICAAAMFGFGLCFVVSQIARL
ncbi:MAG: LysE family transporter [Phycisphaerales bacterium]